MYKSAWLAYKLQNENFSELTEKIIYLNLDRIYEVNIPVFPVKFDFTLLLNILDKERNKGGLCLHHVGEHTLYKFQNYIFENCSPVSQCTVKNFSTLWNEIYKIYKQNTAVCCYSDLFALQQKDSNIIPISKFTTYSEKEIHFISFSLKDLLVTSAIKYLIN